jgi:hypothetical protein
VRFVTGRYQGTVGYVPVTVGYRYLLPGNYKAYVLLRLESFDSVTVRGRRHHDVDVEVVCWRTICSL